MSLGCVCRTTDQLYKAKLGAKNQPFEFEGGKWGNGEMENSRFNRDEAVKVGKFEVPFMVTLRRLFDPFFECLSLASNVCQYVYVTNLQLYFSFSFNFSYSVYVFMFVRKLGVEKSTMFTILV